MENREWQRFTEYFYYQEELGLQLDISKVRFQQVDLERMENSMQRAYQGIRELEAGAVANPDENRQVGHYWLRAPELAPAPEITAEIQATQALIKEFAAQIHQGLVRGERGRSFKQVLVVGIGGSSLGPRFIAEALGSTEDKMKLYFLDNTDPDGIDRVISQLQGELDTTLTLVISKSGGTIETRNGMEEVRLRYQQQGLDFTKHAVSITQAGSRLDNIRRQEGWLAAFPMWDWVGGRTSVLSAVGLLPLALQGIDIDQLLDGARNCDQITRMEETNKNPAALLALMWYLITEGQGGKVMVMLPYKDRLALFSNYLQQLIMESLGKEKDLDGNLVKQGIAVLGNKGSTDQHSYLQQLLDGPDNVFVTFIEVLKDRDTPSQMLAEDSTSGDYLQAFLLGTRRALTQKGKDSITITINQIEARSIGMLVALYERAVSIYALLIHINAYHQPAVELGKKSAAAVISLKNKAIIFLTQHQRQRYTLEQIAQAINEEAEQETLFKILQHLVHNPDHPVFSQQDLSKSIFETVYYANVEAVADER